MGRPDQLDRLHLWQFQAVRDLLFVAAVAGLVWFGYALRAVTVPLLVALLFAYLFEPMVARLASRRRLNRPVVVGGLLATVGIIFVGVLAVIIPVVVTQTADLVDDFQQGRFRETAVTLTGYLPEALQPRAQELIDHLPGGAPTAAAPQAAPAPAPDEEARIRAIVREELEKAGAGGDGSQRWIDVARGGARAAGSVLGGILQLGFLAFLIPFYFFFFSVWYPSVVRFGRSLIPESNRKRTHELFAKMDNVVAGFVRGRIVISLIMGVMLAAGWAACGVPYAIVLGLVVGVFCAVPYLGGVGIPLAVVFLGFQELGQPEAERMAWWGVILWPTLIFGVVQFIEGYVLTPMIAGKATNLDPVTILVVVLAGGSIMGIYGMLLAIPVAACLKILCTDVLLPKVRAWTAGEAEDPLPIDRD
ncbi:MAG: AI-2E family transporter [Planctomycetota bacterium]|jgi:predicted PurR-regulated permease PerM